MTQKIPMTPEGHGNLKKKLEHLKRVERPKTIQAIEVARGHGDLSENAEYDAAKEAQAQLMREIQITEDKLARAQIIDPKKINHDKIAFGATLTLLDTKTDQKIVYQIVGVDESDIQKGKISIESPIARFLVGKGERDVAEVKTPKGIKEYEILKIEYK